MRTFIVWMAALSVLGSGWAASAHAAPPRATSFDDQVTIDGEIHDTPRVMVSGSGVPLRAALRQMVPPAYSINLPNAGAWAATPVGWSAGRSLAQTLRDMLAGHPELAAQIDTDFQLVTVRYRPPFGADTVGAVSGTTATVSIGTPATPASSPAGLPAANVEVGGPLGATAALSAPSGIVASRNASVGDPGTSPNGIAPRITSQPYAIAPVPPIPPAHLATQADRSADNASAASQSAAAGPRPPAAPPRNPEPTPQVWNIALSDRTVRGALTRWTQQAGWRLIWEAPVDFAVDAPASVTGTFDEALQSVVGALAGTESPVQAILYRGNKVLRIVEKGAG